jgi:hypothetical protein
MLRELSENEIENVSGGFDLTGIPATTNANDQGQGSPTKTAVWMAIEMAKEAAKLAEEARQAGT